MAVAQLNTTTLSEALDTGTIEFAVGSTANIVAGNYIVVRGEAMKVQAVPASGRVQVMRGVVGTIARPQPNGGRVYIGTPDQFRAIRESQTAVVGGSGVYPDYMLPGQKAKDDAGNEYILVDCSVQMYSGTTCLISGDGAFSARPVVGGDQGSVGLLVEEGSSAQYAWAQIYGANSYAQDSTITSAGTSANVAAAATSVSTPEVGLAVIAQSSVGAYTIQGMFITGIATSTTTSATSATGVAFPVWLNYPYVTPWRADISSL